MYKTLGVAAIFVAIMSIAGLAQPAAGPASPSSADGTASPEVVKDLAPTGTLRAAINAGNVVLVQKDSNGEVYGVTVDLAQELARRLGVPAQLIVYDGAGKVTDTVKTGAWDIGFIAIEPVRAEVMGFTAPYVIIEGTYLVATDSPLKKVADVDRDGIRIAVAKGSAYDLYLTRTLQHATLVRYPSPPLGFAGYIADKLDAAAGVRQFLIQFAKTNPTLRVMPEHFQEIREAMATPLGRVDGLQYLQAFVEEMKASGFIKKSLQRAGQADAVIAPSAKN
jgi:polar amino acid transport system substrate-binding protein